MPPVVPQLEPAPETPAQSSGPSTRRTQTPTQTEEQQEAKETRYGKALDTHVKLLNIYRVAKRDWDDYHTTVTKLRGKIQGSVIRQKAAKLRTELPVRTWLRDLRASTAPAEEATQRSILVEYNRFIHKEFTEWPQGGPSTWLAKWEDYMARSER